MLLERQDLDDSIERLERSLKKMVSEKDSVSNVSDFYLKQSVMSKRKNRR